MRNATHTHTMHTTQHIQTGGGRMKYAVLYITFHIFIVYAPHITHIYDSCTRDQRDGGHVCVWSVAWRTVCYVCLSASAAPQFMRARLNILFKLVDFKAIIRTTCVATRALGGQHARRSHRQFTIYDNHICRAWLTYCVCICITLCTHAEHLRVFPVA